MTYAEKTSHPIVTEPTIQPKMTSKTMYTGAKKAFELSKFDQHNLEQKLKALKDESPNNSSKYMFRPNKNRIRRISCNQ